MKITVKISDIEVSIERPEFFEFKSETYQKQQYNETILPTIQEATKSALELYNNRIEKLKDTE